MASASVSPSGPITIPNGGTVDVAVSWNLDPGTPDTQGHLRLELGGAVVFDGPVAKQGRPAEQEPQIVTANPQPGQAVLTCDVGSLVPTGPRSFRLS